jgi:hypothetical protein
MTDLHSRFDDIDTYFANLAQRDIVEQYSADCAKWLAELPAVKEIGYNPFLPLSGQDCYYQYFRLLEQNGVSTAAEEYLPTRSWFMRGTISAPLLLTAALAGKGKYVVPTAGDFPEDLYYIIHA